MIDVIKQQLELTADELKQPTILKQKDSVFYLLLNTKANTFSSAFTRSIHRQLDIIEANEGATSLVTISLSKLFSGGMDLREMQKLTVEQQAHTLQEFVNLIGRVTVLPFPTLCLVRGGAAAGGCIFAVAHDNVYVAGKATFSAKEHALGIPFPPGALSVLRKRITYPSVFRNLVIECMDYSAEEALKAKLIDGVWSEQEAFEKVTDIALSLSDFGDNKQNLGRIKRQLYKDVTLNCLDRQINPNNWSFFKLKEFPKL